MSEVLIVGAGPTGLVLALWLRKFGVDVRIIDQTAQPGTTSRALAVQARTLELYRQLDLADAVVARGHRTPAVNLWARGHRAARVSFETIGEGLTPYPFMHIFPQDEHERLLIERLHDFGVSVERQTQLVSLSEEGDTVGAQLLRSGGQQERAQVRYVAGCDGAHSQVRSAIGASFPGGTYRQLFYVADIEGAGPPLDGELHVDLDEADFLAVFPLAGENRVRLVGTVRDERAEHPDTLKFGDVSHRAIENLKLEVRQVNWFSTYRVHHRVADHFSRGRLFLLGDAAHIHSPAGGQGMNTGIGDAINLAWKLAGVLQSRAPASLLESFEAERIPFARRLVATTDRVFTFATAEGPVAEFVRTRLAPTVLSTAFSFDAVRDYMFRTVSQLMLNYRRSPLSEGSVGGVHSGDRLPFVAGSPDNYASLKDPVWQVHLYGEASERLQARCTQLNLPLHVFPFTLAHERAGFAQNALYVLRPDTYLAFVTPGPDPGRLELYFTSRELRPG